jgi:hypothetical protein
MGLSKAQEDLRSKAGMGMKGKKKAYHCKMEG